MKKIIVMMCCAVCIAARAFSQDSFCVDLSFYASTRGEMQINVIPQWKFPFLQGSHPLTSENNLALKMDARLSPIWAGLTGDTILTVFPFLSFNIGSMAGTGWNYDILGKVQIVGLGLNRKININDPDSGVIGNGFDGVVWDVHAGTMLQFDLTAFFPGDWNHFVMRYYNRMEYFAYTKAHGDDFWYCMGDSGLNQNAFRYKFELFAGYAMPIFIDLVGVQLEGTLPFYNFETGDDVRDRGFSYTTAFIVNFKINQQWSIMTITRIANGFKDPDKYGYERKWGFDCVQFIADWRIKNSRGL